MPSSNALAFKDFVPKQLRAPRFGLSSQALEGEYETFESAVAAMNDWRRTEPVHVVQLETVVLPNLWANWEHGSIDPALSAGQGSPIWFQFIRVWYERSESGDPSEAPRD